MANFNSIYQLINESYHELSPQMQMVWLIIAFLVPAILILVGYISVLNSYLHYHKIKNDQLKKEIEDLLIEYLFDESDFDSYLQKFNHWFTAKTTQVNRRKGVLKNYIYEYHQNIKGELSEKLELLYVGLEFDSFLINNFKKANKSNKTWIIRELSHMKCKSAIGLLEKNSTNKNKEIRLEAQIGLITFKKFEALDFIEHLKTPLSNWNQLVILETLQDLSNNEKIKDPKAFLNSQNDSVVVFGLKYAQMYFRIDKRDDIIKLMHHPNNSVLKEVINTLVALQIRDAYKDLNDLYLRSTEAIKIKILEAIQKLHPIEEKAFLLEQFSSASAYLKHHIYKALVNIDPNFNINDLSSKNNNQSLSFYELS